MDALNWYFEMVDEARRNSNFRYFDMDNAQKNGLSQYEFKKICAIILRIRLMVRCCHINDKGYCAPIARIVRKEIEADNRMKHKVGIKIWVFADKKGFHVLPVYDNRLVIECRESNVKALKLREYIQTPWTYRKYRKEYYNFRNVMHSRYRLPEDSLFTTFEKLFAENDIAKFESECAQIYKKELSARIQNKRKKSNKHVHMI